ncbi:hypothetical protein KQI86_05055 [Clostridium sp. MSJ-11]|uniref:Lipoprotein n=1 Tax=Clostridium mobile TaxID=2841512 RepID=A0ABS6EER5_9CLOT|nr:hypothetical protein [Clostridium mobile]MBU5483689.1 hypothetical protein [Clostridium mobile]
MNKKLVSIIISALIVTSLSACGNKKSDTTVDNKNKENITITNPDDKSDENKTIQTSAAKTKPNEKTDEDKTIQTSATKTESNEKTNEDKTTNRYSIAGIDNPSEFKNTFNNIKELVASNDKEKVAEYINFPINVHIGGKKVAIETKDQFIKNYDEIFNDNVKAKLANQKVEETFVNADGIMVGDGEIWISVFNNSAHKYLIYAINNN